MPGIRSVRGDVNVILNGMIRDGVITSFETNLGTPSEAFAPHVRVAANLVTDHRMPGYNARAVRELRDRIMRQLEPPAPGVIVSVRGERGTARPDAPGGVSGEQCRAARRLVGWSLEKHAHRAGVSLQVIGAFERGESVPRPEKLAAIMGALKAAGVEFIEEAPGVKIKNANE